MAFLRIAAALSFIGTRGLLICWSIFFDDFTAVAPEKVAGNTQLYIEFLFRLLGVNFFLPRATRPHLLHLFQIAWNAV